MHIFSLYEKEVCSRAPSTVVPSRPMTLMTLKGGSRLMALMTLKGGPKPRTMILMTLKGGSRPMVLMTRKGVPLGWL